MTLFIDGREYQPIATAASRLQTTETRVLMLIKQQALQGEQLEGSWFVEEASLSSFDPGAARKHPVQSNCSACSVSACACR